MPDTEHSLSVLEGITPSKAIVKLAVPATLALLAKAVYNIVDTAYIGMLHSDIALTAVGVTLPLLLIMVSIENIFAAGAAVLAGRQLGAKDEARASSTVTTIVGISVAVGLVLCVGGIIFIEPLLRAFGASDTSLPMAKDYAFWMFIAALANLPAQSMNCAARAESSVKISSVAVIVGAALNVILDPIFMFDWGFGMGVEGASLATTVSQFVTFFILAWFYLSGKSVIKLNIKRFKLSWDFLKAVTVIGIPTAVIQICLSVASSLTNIVAASLPQADEIIAAYGVVQRLILIGCYVVMGFMQGYQPVASYAFGAGEEDRFRQSVRFALKGSLLLTVLVAVIYILLARPLVMLFNRNPVIIEYGKKLLISQVVIYPAFGLCYMMTITFQTIGAAQYGLFLSMIRQGLFYLPFTDTYFPDHDVRFIAVNDGVDSDQGDDDFSPFRNIMNEWYAKDISRKVRSSKKLRGNAGDPMCPPPYGYKKDPDNPRKWIIDDEAAEVVRRIYRLCVEGKGIETTARLLQEDGILTPTQYWESKGIRKGGKKSQDTPCKWCKTTITKILTLREYTGTLVNFKTYSKSFKNKRRLDNPEENWAIFENHHEAIIDKTTWEQVQKLREGTKRRKPKNTEKNMFAGLLYCADCGHKLHYNINHPNSSIEYFNCSNYRGNRGTCNETHYIRADSLEQVVLLELNRMVSYLKNHAEEFAELLAQKTTKDYERESQNRRQRLQELMARNKEVDRLFERIYEDNVSGKLTDERFMKMSQRYDEEQQQLKKDIEELQRQCDRENDRAFCKEQFLKAVRKFMEMKTLTPTILHELVERIDVYQTQGRGKNRTQRIVIHYNFIGILDLPEVEEYPDNVVLDSRQGVAIEYLVGKAS